MIPKNEDETLRLKNDHQFDVIIIGGGFYGCCLALLMRNYYENILIIEKEENLLLRASSINQARVHSGYHYPRSLITAYRSFVNFPRFVLDFRDCIIDDFEKVYAIARRGSKVNAYQFKEICNEIGAYIKPAPLKIKKLFDMNNIEEVFSVKEVAFDASKLRNTIKKKLEKAKVTICYRIEVNRVEQTENDKIKVFLSKGDVCLQANQVFNCTYSQINKLLRNSNIPLLPLKHELTEMVLIEVPDELNNIGITVMDGLFFSTMPYPARNLHSLSHVRYTPHYSWNDFDQFIDGHAQLKNIKLKSNFPYMIKDAQRYLPIINKASYVDSLYEIKTVLVQNEIDDGRPILFRKDYSIKNFSIVMGAKIDNIYDILDMIGEIKDYSLHSKKRKWRF